MRFLKRLAIWLRWPMATLAIAVIGLILLTRAQALDGTVQVWAKRGNFTASQGLLWFQALDDINRRGSTIASAEWHWTEPIAMSAPSSAGTLGSWVGVRMWGDTAVRVIVTLPIVASVAAALAATGFWLRRRDVVAAKQTPKPAGPRGHSFARRGARVIGWWRWPMLLCALLLVAVAVGSYTWDLRCDAVFPLGRIDFWIQDATVSVGVSGQGSVIPLLKTSTFTGQSDWSTASIKAAVTDCQPWYFTRPALPSASPGTGGLVAEVPSWTMPFPIGILALAGFLLHRRETKPDECPRCGYKLAGAAVCPECGTAAPHASTPPFSP